MTCASAGHAEICKHDDQMVEAMLHAVLSGLATGLPWWCGCHGPPAIAPNLPGREVQSVPVCLAFVSRFPVKNVETVGKSWGSC